MSLPLLPQECVQDGMEAITEYFRMHINDVGFNHLINTFLQYLHRRWGPVTISVYLEGSRTNNAVEGFHSI